MRFMAEIVYICHTGKSSKPYAIKCVKMSSPRREAVLVELWKEYLKIYDDSECFKPLETLNIYQYSLHV